jgi:uncharacterized protein (TIGR03437 family)
MLPGPTTYDGNSVTVTDSAGVARPAPLFWVSPSQINFEIPAGTAAGTATVTIYNQNGASQATTIHIVGVSPGLYVMNSTGSVAAWALPVISGVHQPLLPAWQGAIDLSGANEQVYLEMYGTGIRNAQNVTVTVGGLNVGVLYAGPAPGFIGEDQVNIGPLPPSLAGKGSVDILLNADGNPANTVNIAIQ